MNDPKYHPNLMIMYKTLGFGYADTTNVFRVQGGSGSGGAAKIDADDEYDYIGAGAGVSSDKPPTEQELLDILDELDPLESGKQRGKLKDTQRETMEDADKTDAGYKNILTVYDNCSNAEIQLYGDWYHQANADCKKIAAEIAPSLEALGIDADPVTVVVSMVAATSQGTLWEENLRMARDIIVARSLPKNIVVTDGTDDDEGDEGSTKEKKFKITKQNLMNVQRILQGGKGVLQSNKFKTFEASIADPTRYENSVVVDTHAACIWIGKRLGVMSKEFTRFRPSGTRLALMVRDYRRASGSIGRVTPQALQAITWSVWRRLPPKFQTDFMRNLGTESTVDPEKAFRIHPEVILFKALYPYLYATVNPEAAKQTWRWKYDRFGKLSPHDRPKGVSLEDWKKAKDLYEAYDPRPHHTADEFMLAVHKFGPDMWRYYGFPKDAWDSFMRDHPRWADSLTEHQQSYVASMMDTVASRIVRFR